MASKSPKVVQTVFRDRGPASDSDSGTVVVQKSRSIGVSEMFPATAKVVAAAFKSTDPKAKAALKSYAKAAEAGTVHAERIRGSVPNHNTRTKSPLPAKVAKARAARKALNTPKKAKIKRVIPVTAGPKTAKPAVYKKDAHLPLVERLNPKLLEQLRTRAVTNAAAAEALGVTETYLCHTVAQIQKKEPGVTVQDRAARSKLATARRQTRAELAKKVNRQQLTLAQAAKQANCSERTMFRYCAEYANVK